MADGNLPWASICAVDARMDALQPRLSGFYVRLLVLAGVSWAARAAELVLFVFTRVLVAKNMGLGTHALQALGAAVFLGALGGGPLFGFVADRYGRRTALLLAMVLSLVGLALSAMARQDYQLIVARVVAGVGLGGEVPAATVLIQELSPRSMRGRMVALLEAFTGIGGLAGVVLAFGVAPHLGWRVTYLAFCGCVFYSGVLRLRLPESPRWLASVGRADEALVQLERMERMHGRYTEVNVGPRHQEESLNESRPTQSVGSSKLKPPYLLQHTLVLWALWTAVSMGSYALGTYVPTLMSLTGFNVFASWTTVALLGVSQVVGCVVTASMLDVHDEKRVLATLTSLAAVTSITLSYLPWSRAVVVTGSCCMAALLLAIWSCVLAYTPKHFATPTCGRGVAYALAFSRLGAIGGSLLYPHMYDVWLLSVSSISWIFAMLLVGVVFVVLLPWGYNPPRIQDVYVSGEVGMYLECGSVGGDGEESPLVTPSEKR